jgi:hypothetical protein
MGSNFPSRLFTRFNGWHSSSTVFTHPPFGGLKWKLRFRLLKYTFIAEAKDILLYRTGWMVVGQPESVNGDLMRKVELDKLALEKKGGELYAPWGSTGHKVHVNVFFGPIGEVEFYDTRACLRVLRCWESKPLWQVESGRQSVKWSCVCWQMRVCSSFLKSCGVI